MHWKDYVRIISRASAAAQRLASGPVLEQLVRFNAERRELVS